MRSVDHLGDGSESNASASSSCCRCWVDCSNISLGGRGSVEEQGKGHLKGDLCGLDTDSYRGGRGYQRAWIR